MRADYVIVGSGAGGSVLAERLSRRGATVVVLEAGGHDRHPVHRVPKGFFCTMHSPRYVEEFLAGPYGCLATTDHWWRGRVVGGSTTLNGAVWNRGWAPDYDRLVDDGNPGWGWDAFLDAYRCIERFQLGGSALRGGTGPVGIEIAGPPEPLSEAFIASGATLGMRRVLDVNGSDEDRIGYTQCNTRRGERMSAARCFLRPALRRPQVRLVTRAEVGMLRFDGRRAVGVRARIRGRLVDVEATREVLVCGGFLDSPLLLERSGIGRGDILAAAGVRQLVESPYVGERLSEHRGIRLMYRARDVAGYNRLVSTPARRFATGARYVVERRGVIAQGSTNVLTFFRADDAADRPDTYGSFKPISTRSVTLHDKRFDVEREPGLMLALYPLRPTSRGRIHITGPTPDDRAAIDPGFLTTDHDRFLIGRIGHKARELFASGPVADLVREETYPGSRVLRDDDFIALAETEGTTGYHTLGTCAMGPRDEDVVDADLRVRGVDGVRVVDASVFPHQPSGSTSAPTQAMAWLAASRILAG